MLGRCPVRDLEIQELSALRLVRDENRNNFTKNMKTRAASIAPATAREVCQHE